MQLYNNGFLILLISFIWRAMYIFGIIEFSFTSSSELMESCIFGFSIAYTVPICLVLLSETDQCLNTTLKDFDILVVIKYEKCPPPPPSSEWQSGVAPL